MTISLGKDLWAYLQLNNAFHKGKDTLSPWDSKDIGFQFFADGLKKI